MVTQVGECHGNIQHPWEENAQRMPQLLDLMVTGNSMDNTSFLLTCAELLMQSFFLFQEELFSSIIPALLIGGPQRDSEEIIPHVDRRNGLACFKVEHLQLVRFGEGALSEELHLQAGWSLNALRGKYKFLCRKSKPSYANQPAQPQMRSSCACRYR